MLANRLKAILAERNMTIQNLVENTTLSRNTISNLINKPEGNINTSTVDEICSFLGISIADFFVFYPYSLVKTGLTLGKDFQNESEYPYIILIFKRLGEELNELFNFMVEKQRTESGMPVLCVVISNDDPVMKQIYEEMPPYFQQVVIDRLATNAKPLLYTYFKSHPEARNYQVIDARTRKDEIGKSIPNKIALEYRFEFSNLSVVRKNLYDLKEINKSLDD